MPPMGGSQVTAIGKGIMRKEYNDYYEYLQDAYEQQTDRYKNITKTER